MSESYHFQVNLGGMLDILSNHLYKSPDVFLRELLQNGIDAITQRKKRQPDWNDGKIHISLDEGRKMRIYDNGAGLNEQEIHRFLAVIGQSSKTELVNGAIPEDYIGRFGIGLLSCFMVSNSIVITTRPFLGGTAHIWRGNPDGTYTLEEIEDCQPGTTVILQAKSGCERYFQSDTIERLVQYYGLALPVPIYLNRGFRLNDIPKNFLGATRTQLLDFGRWLFEESFLDAIPIQTKHLSGVAYILPYATATTVKGGHRIYLKQMLLTEQGESLLPPWAFFLRCFLNTTGLRPTASREGFYEDEMLQQARLEFSKAVSGYLSDIAQRDTKLIQKMVQTHVLAIKSMAIWNRELFELFIDYLPFQTSEGELRGKDLKQVDEIFYVGTTEQFKQLKPIFTAQKRLLVCTGYVYDRELLDQMVNIYDLSIQPLSEDDIETVLMDLTPEEEYEISFLMRIANRSLEHFDCEIQVRRFVPVSLPVLYSISAEVQFLRQMKNAKDMSENGVFSEVLASMIDDTPERRESILYLNLNSPLIQRIADLKDVSLISSIVKILYVQALLGGGYTVRSEELQVMSQALLRMVDWKQERE